MHESPMSESTFPYELVSLEDRYVRLELDLECSFDQVIAYVDRAIRFTRQEGKRLLLVNASNIRGFPSPSLVDRYHMVESWAVASSGAVRMAMVVPATLIDLEKIGVTMARNRSFIAEAFDSEADALACLLGSSN